MKAQVLLTALVLIFSSNQKSHGAPSDECLAYSGSGNPYNFEEFIDDSENPLTVICAALQYAFDYELTVNSMVEATAFTYLEVSDLEEAGELCEDTDLSDNDIDIWDNVYETFEEISDGSYNFNLCHIIRYLDE